MTGPPDPVAAIAAGPAGAHIGAFFDVDGTLVDGFTAVAHAGHRIRRGQAGIGEVLGVIEAASRYRLGRMKFDHLLARASGYLRGESLAELEILGADLFTRRIEPRMYPDMRRIVRAHQSQGHTVAVCSSALTMHVGPVARSLGVSHILCNEFEVDDAGLLTGTIRRPIIWGTRKADAVLRFSEERAIELGGSYFYSDGDEDLPLLGLVGHPRPVNPRRNLAATAAANGWQVLHMSNRTRRAT